MLVQGKPYRTIWVDEQNPAVIKVIDQRYLPHQFVIESLTTVEDCITAIKDMHIRGAGLIGVTAAYGMYLAALDTINSDFFETHILDAANRLIATRPTAVNLSWAVNKQLAILNNTPAVSEKAAAALLSANQMADQDAQYCKQIGEQGLEIIEAIAKKKNNETVHILTHCNAGWLAFVDYGSATAPIYAAFKKGINLHVWVDETRPRNQGASLTAWELLEQGIPHTIITDNTGGHLMQHGMVDMVIVGTDRTTSNGDVANKIGTYLKALAAKDNGIPFYVAVPSSSIDWSLTDGIKEIIIEERNSEEVKYITGLNDGEMKKVLVTPEKSPAANYGFDVTPARLITGLITERGVCEANQQSLQNLFPEIQ
jgi:methylthioribose-1-phosphate isomerase